MIRYWFKILKSKIFSQEVLILLLALIAFIFSAEFKTIYAQESNNLIINEFMANPEGTDTGHEWIEFKNFSYSDINLQNWYMQNESNTGNVRIFTFPSIIVPARSIFVIEESLVTSSVNNKFTLGAEKLNLYNTAKRLSLFNSNNSLVDELFYTSADSGKSFERQGELCSTIKINSLGHTLGLENSSVLPECTSNNIKILFSKDQTNWFEDVSILQGQTFYFKLSEDQSNVLWLDENNEEIQTNYLDFSTNIIKAQFDYFGTQKIIENSNIKKIQKIYINEIGKSSGTYWLELNNPNNIDQELSLLDISSNSIKVNTSNCLVIKANDLCVIELSNQPQFIQISFEGDIIDSLNLEPIDILDAKSYGILNSEFMYLMPTKALANKSIINLIITELYPNPESGETEWVEVYNPTDSTVDLSGLSFREFSASSSTYTTKKSNLPSIPLTAKSHIYVDNLSITLNNSGDKIGLFYEDIPIDEFEYSQSLIGKSIALEFIDGVYAKNIIDINLVIPSPGELNKATVVQNVKFKDLQNFESSNLIKLTAKVIFKPNEFGNVDYIVFDGENFGYVKSTSTLEIGKVYEFLGNSLYSNEDYTFQSTKSTTLNQNLLIDFINKNSLDFNQLAICTPVKLTVSITRVYTKSFLADFGGYNFRFLSRNSISNISKLDRVTLEGYIKFDGSVYTFFIENIIQILKPQSSNNLPTSYSSASSNNGSSNSSTQTSGTTKKDPQIIKQTSGSTNNFSSQNFTPDTSTVKTVEFYNSLTPSNYTSNKVSTNFEFGILTTYVIIVLVVLNLLLLIFLFKDYINYFKSNFEYIKFKINQS